jgi:hypothetical protein
MQNKQIEEVRSGSGRGRGKKLELERKEVENA